MQCSHNSPGRPKICYTTTRGKLVWFNPQTVSPSKKKSNFAERFYFHCQKLMLHFSEISEKYNKKNNIRYPIVPPAAWDSQIVFSDTKREMDERVCCVSVRLFEEAEILTQDITAKWCWEKTVATPLLMLNILFVCLFVFRAHSAFLLQSVPKVCERKKCSKICQQQGGGTQCHNFQRRFADITKKEKEKKNPQNLSWVSSRDVIGIANDSPECLKSGSLWVWKSVSLEVRLWNAAFSVCI